MHVDPAAFRPPSPMAVPHPGRDGILQGLSRSPARLVLVIAMIVVAGLLAATDFPRHWDDSAAYIAMAQGLPALMPWAGRILLPGMVKTLTGLFHLGMDAGFEGVTCLSFICWLSLTSLRWRMSPWLPCFLIVPLVVAGLQSVYITDMFHMALTALFFVLLSWNVFAASAFMIVMMTARESSMVFAFVAAGVLFCNRRWLGGVVMLAAYAAGAAIVHHAAAGAQNVHRMPEALYLLSKMPLNFVRNWLGTLVWTNGYAWCGDPLVTMSLPGKLHLGVITRIGFCSPAPGIVLTTASSYVTVFGVLPAILIAVVRSQGIPRSLWRTAWWPTAFISGVVLLVLGPLAGSPVDRVLGFGWPLAFIALPAIWRGAPDWRLAGLQLCAAWSPLLLSRLLDPHAGDVTFIGVSTGAAVAGAALVIGAVTNWMAYRKVFFFEKKHQETFANGART